MSSSDYPEHLNPFREEKKHSGLNIFHTLKIVKGNIRQSFRSKKKRDEVQVRQKTDPFFPRNVVSLQPTLSVSHEEAASPALPRSRFRERLAKSYLNGARNPFEEESESGSHKEATKRPPRRKKRAPPPPRSASNLEANDEKNNSKWSLTSVETDISTDNISEVDCSNIVEDLEIVNELQQFNKEMDKLNDDANNNLVINDDRAKEAKDNKSDNIPDVVVSCVDEHNSCDSWKICKADDTVQADNIESNTSPPKHETESENIIGGFSNDVSSENFELVHEQENTEERNEKQGMQNLTTIKTDTNYQEAEGIENVNDMANNKENERLENLSTDSSVEDLKIVDITTNLHSIQVDNIIVEENHKENDEESTGACEKSPSVCEENEMNGLKENDEDDKCEEISLNFNERKSIYIYGSQDELESSPVTNGVYSEKFSMYIKGSREELDDKPTSDGADSSEIGDTGPIPKQRKHKLNKNDLLGQHL